jgi:hypothetical protein
VMGENFLDRNILNFILEHPCYNPE